MTSKLIFLDFEASSLDADSYPIEIGWVDESGQGESYLIRPVPAWTDWSHASQRVHGITRAEIEQHGTPAATVARRAHAAFAGKKLISDNPMHEAYWLNRLLDTAGLRHRAVEHVQVALSDEISRVSNRITAEEAVAVASSAFEGARMSTTRHRALPDAENLWTRWKAVREALTTRVTPTGYCACCGAPRISGQMTHDRECIWFESDGEAAISYTRISGTCPDKAG